jgi:ElaB/YqjD/DUF883 family membrane-anchored ribosome-binding protein
MAQRDELNTQGAERTADEIRRDIAAKRETISDTVDRLGERLQQSLDWREFIANHPYAATGVAAGAGFLLTRLFRRRQSPLDRVRNAVVDTVEDVTDTVRHSVERLFWKTAAPGVLKGAVYSFATKTAMDLVRRKAADMVSNERHAYDEHSAPSTAWAEFEANVPGSSKRPS